MHTRSKKGKSEREEKKKDGQTTNDVAGRFAIGIRSSIAQGVLHIYKQANKSTKTLWTNE